MRHHRRSGSKCPSRQLHTGIAGLHVVHRLPVVGLGTMRGLFYAQQIADGAQAAFVAVLVDAQALIRLRDGAASDLDLLARRVIFVIRLATCSRISSR